MQTFDERAISAARAIDTLTPEQFQTVRALIATDLGRGRDAWPAVSWLAATNDERSKQIIVRELEHVINGSTSELLSHEAAVDNFSSDVVFGRASIERRRVSRAFDFLTALLRSMSRPATPPPSTASTEIDGGDVMTGVRAAGPAPMDLGFERTVDRRRADAERQADREQELNRLGVQPGNGLPFWELYMRRRRHKSWG